MLRCRADNSVWFAKKARQSLDSKCQTQHMCTCLGQFPFIEQERHVHFVCCRTLFTEREKSPNADVAKSPTKIRNTVRRRSEKLETPPLVRPAGTPG